MIMNCGRFSLLLNMLWFIRFTYMHLFHSRTDAKCAIARISCILTKHILFMNKLITKLRSQNESSQYSMYFNGISRQSCLKELHIPPSSVGISIRDLMNQSPATSSRGSTSGALNLPYIASQLLS